MHKNKNLPQSAHEKGGGALHVVVIPLFRISHFWRSEKHTVKRFFDECQTSGNYCTCLESDWDRIGYAKNYICCIRVFSLMISIRHSKQYYSFIRIFSNVNKHETHVRKVYFLIAWESIE